MPEQISSYRLEAEIARGGMGIVYRGVHTVFDEIVGIKAIYPELTLNPELRQRFLNEAKIQRRLQHPNIVQIREFLIDQGKFYIVMEFIEGETLAHHLRQLGRPMQASEAIEIFRQALEGLGYAHAQGGIHRDIKPSNIMLTRQGVAKLTDFGIARALGTPKLTRTGTALGTPAYMSPEQIQGTKLDHRTDICSLGITLYEMLTGRVPFERLGDSDSDYPVLEGHMHQAPMPPTQLVSGIPPFLEGAILKALEKGPENRFASCQEFHAALVPPPLGDTQVAVVAPPQQDIFVLERTLSGHDGAVNSVAVSPDGRLVASGSGDKTVKVWDGATGALGLTLSGHSASLCCVAFSPDGRLLASGALDKTIKLWDGATGSLKQTLSGRGVWDQSMAFSPDGHLLASGSLGDTIELWDASTGALKQTLSAPGSSVGSLAFSPDGRLLATGSWWEFGERPTIIKLWDVGTGALEQWLALEPASSTRAVAFSPDGRLLASAQMTAEGTVCLWDLATSATKHSLRGGGSEVYCVAFSPDGRLLACGSADKTVKLWDVATGTQEQTLSGHQDIVASAAFSPDGRLLASGSADKTVKLWRCRQ